MYGWTSISTIALHQEYRTRSGWTEEVPFLFPMKTGHVLVMCFSSVANHKRSYQLDFLENKSIIQGQNPHNWCYRDQIETQMKLKGWFMKSTLNVMIFTSFHRFNHLSFSLWVFPCGFNDYVYRIEFVGSDRLELSLLVVIQGARGYVQRTSP